MNYSLAAVAVNPKKKETIREWGEGGGGFALNASDSDWFDAFADAGRGLGWWMQGLWCHIIHELHSHWPQFPLCLRLCTQRDGNWAFSSAERRNWLSRVKESCGGWWVIVSSIQIRGIMADFFLFFFFYQWEERRGLFLISSQGQQRTQFREYNVTSDIKTPNPSTCLCDLSYSNHMGTVVRDYIRKAVGTWVVSHAADFSNDRHCWRVTEHCTILLPDLDVLFCVTAWPPVVCQDGVTKAPKLSGIVTDTQYDQCTCVFIYKHILSCRG